MGAVTRAPGPERRSDSASRAFDPDVSEQRLCSRSAPSARAREGGDSEVMKRREFVKAVGRLSGLAVSARWLDFQPPNRLTAVPSLLIPMDDVQTDHLKAYGLTYRAIQAGLKAEWLLNYRGGSFLIPDLDALRRDAALNGIRTEPVDSAMTAVRGEIEANNMDAVPLEKASKEAVARSIHGCLEKGGFLFAMCTATESIDLALAAEKVDIAATFADGTPIDPDADTKLDWAKSFAFTGAHLENNPLIASFSDIDGHQVNSGARRQPLGAFKLFNFSAKIDPVPTMLVQNHRQVIPDFYGLTTSFTRTHLKPGATILADEEGAPWVKYVHGALGKGTWTFFGGHDPEDPQHQIGDPPTDLSLHPHSPGYRLILNNVLFPAAKKKELKT